MIRELNLKIINKKEPGESQCMMGWCISYLWFSICEHGEARVNRKFWIEIKAVSLHFILHGI